MSILDIRINKLEKLKTLSKMKNNILDIRINRLEKVKALLKKSKGKDIFDDAGEEYDCENPECIASYLFFNLCSKQDKEKYTKINFVGETKYFMHMWVQDYLNIHWGDVELLLQQKGD